MSAWFERCARMRRGNIARAMVRQRMRRPRLWRCQMKNSAEITSAAPSEVSESCEPTENSRMLRWPQKNRIPDEREPNLRADREQQVAELAEEKCNAGRKIQRMLLTPGGRPNVLPKSKDC